MKIAAARLLLGSWNLVSYVEIDENGKTSHPVGEKPAGSIIYADDGRMSAQIMYENWTLDNPNVADAYFLGYSGRFVVDQSEQKVSHHIEISAIPSWMGSVQERAMVFRDKGTLQLSTLAPVKTTSGMRMAQLVWMRY